MKGEEVKGSDDLGLPLDAVTETFAILAVRGAGKYNAAVVMAEEMYRAGLPWVAIDPKGDWWGGQVLSGGERFRTRGAGIPQTCPDLVGLARACSPAM
jgi:Helicase HerA, central domain